MKRQILFSAFMFVLASGNISPAISQVPPSSSNLVSFEKTDDSAWPYAWRIAIPDELSKTGSFQIRSEVRDPTLAAKDDKYGFDTDLLSMVLAAATDIQEKPQDPVNIKFRLNPFTPVNRFDPHLEVSAGFSRVASFILHADVPASFRAYATSGPLKMLGSKVADIRVADDKTFKDGRLPLVTLTTTDGAKTFIYDVFLEKLPASSGGPSQ